MSDESTERVFGLGCLQHGLNLIHKALFIYLFSSSFFLHFHFYTLKRLARVQNSLIVVGQYSRKNK